MISNSSAWPEVVLGEVCEFKYGKGLPESKRVVGKVAVYGSNGIVGQHNEAITDGLTIVVGRKRSFGEVNLSYDSCWPIDTTYYIDRTATNADLRWLAYRLTALGLTKLNRAAAVPGLNREDAYRKRLLLPPLAEQRRITAILDQAEALRTKRRRTLIQLGTLTRSLFLDLFGDPVANQKGWGRRPLTELLTSIDSGWSPTCLDRPVVGDEWGVLKLGAVTWCEYNPAENKALPPNLKPDPGLEVKAGDLLFTRKNTYELVAACALVHETPPHLLMSDLIFRLRLRPDAPLDSCFLHQLLINPMKRREIQKLAGGSAGSMPNISKGRLQAALIEVPPLPLQREFTAQVSAVERLKAVQRMSLAKLDALFASLQHRAFRGEL